MRAPRAPDLDAPDARAQAATPDWLTPSEAAILLGVPLASVEALAAEGRIRVTAALPGRRGPSTGMVSSRDLRAALGTTARAPSAPPVPPAPPPPAPPAGIRTPSIPPIVVLPEEARAPAPPVVVPARERPGGILAPTRVPARPNRRPGRSRVLVVGVSLVVLVAAVAGVAATRGKGRPLGALSSPRATPPASPPATPAPEASPGALALEEPRFTVQGGWLSAAVAVTNPNRGWWVPYLDVIFNVRGPHGERVAAPVRTVTVPPGGSVEAILTGVALPRRATVASVHAALGLPEWDTATTFRPSPLELLGQGLNSAPAGGLQVGVLVSNTADEDAWGTITCVTRDEAGGLTGAGTATPKILAGRHRMVWVPVPHPSPGSTGATCEIVPVGG